MARFLYFLCVECQLFKYMENHNENHDYGCIEGVALTDTLSEIMSSLAGGYALLCFYENKGLQPDKRKLSRWEKRREEIAAIRNYFSKDDKSFDDIRRWIKMYSEEKKQVENLRTKYADAA